MTEKSKTYDMSNPRVASLVNDSDGTPEGEEEVLSAKNKDAVRATAYRQPRHALDPNLGGKVSTNDNYIDPRDPMED